MLCFNQGMFSPFKTVLKVVGGLVALMVIAGLTLAYFADSDTENRSSQVIQAIQREEQVVLLSLGIQGIEEENKKNASFFGISVPGTGKTTFLQYSFYAKLGIEGGEVRITESGEGKYQISIPEFIFIGHDKIDFRLVVEDNGVLSWTREKIDQTKMINAILSGKGKQAYIEKHDEILRDQAINFYTSIVKSVDNDANIEFDFAD